MILTISLHGDHSRVTGNPRKQSPNCLQCLVFGNFIHFELTAAIALHADRDIPRAFTGLHAVKPPAAAFSR